MLNQCRNYTALEPLTKPRHQLHMQAFLPGKHQWYGCLLQLLLSPCCILGSVSQSAAALACLNTGQKLDQHLFCLSMLDQQADQSKLLLTWSVYSLAS